MQFSTLSVALFAGLGFAQFSGLPTCAVRTPPPSSPNLDCSLSLSHVNTH